MYVVQRTSAIDVQRGRRQYRLQPSSVTDVGSTRRRETLRDRFKVPYIFSLWDWNKVRCALTNVWGPTRFDRKAKVTHLCPGNFICSVPRVNASRADGCPGCIPNA